MSWPAPYDPHSTASPVTGPLPTAHRSWWQRVILGLGIGVTVACLSASGFVTYQTARIGNIERFDDLPNIVEVASGQPQNWLVVGSDNRDDITGNRTDTIMIVRVDPEGNHLDILSLQRDLWIPIAGTNSSERINSAYGNNETPRRLIDTIKLNFDIDVNHYVEIDFRTFQSIVQAVGGVPMYFDRPMRDRAAGLTVLSATPGAAPGCVTLDGEQALAFARSRHLEYQEGTRWKEDPSSDFGRVSRQQYFMRRMFARAALKARSNPKVVNDLVGAANEYVKLDSKVDLDQAGSMFRRFGSFDADAIKSWTLPTRPDTTAGGAMVLKVVPEASVSILNIFRGLDPHDADPRTLAFSIANGSGKTGQAAQVQEAYRAIGYKAEVAGDGGHAARTQIRHGTGGQDTAGQIERHLTAGADVVPDPDLAAGKVVLVTGEDFTTVMRRPRPWVPPVAAPEEPSLTTTTGRGSKSTTTAPTTTEAPPHNTGDSLVGVVPGQAPPGIDCS